MGDRLSLIRERWLLLVKKREKERREIDRELMLEKDTREVLKAEQGAQEGSKEGSAVCGGNE